MERLHIDAAVKVTRGEDAEELLVAQNDAASIGESGGIERVDEDRWLLAQECERRHWFRSEKAAADDHNYVNYLDFAGYQALAGMRFPRAIERPSRSCALRICSYNFTFDLLGIAHGRRPSTPTGGPPKVGPDQMSTTRPSGARSGEHTQRVARLGAIKAKTAATNTLRGMLITAPEPLRAQLPTGGLPNKIIDACGRLRPDNDHLHDPTQATKAALRSIAQRARSLRGEIKALDTHIQALVAATAPATLAVFAMGPTPPPRSS